MSETSHALAVAITELQRSLKEARDARDALGRAAMDATASRDELAEECEAKAALIAGMDQRLAALDAENARLREALIGVLRVADRKTVEFDAARAALAPATDAQGDG